LKNVVVNAAYVIDWLANNHKLINNMKKLILSKKYTYSNIAIINVIMDWYKPYHI